MTTLRKLLIRAGNAGNILQEESISGNTNTLKNLYDIAVEKGESTRKSKCVKVQDNGQMCKSKIENDAWLSETSYCNGTGEKDVSSGDQNVTVVTGIAGKDRVCAICIFTSIYVKCISNTMM